MNHLVPPNLSPLIRAITARGPDGYRAWGNAECVFADLRVVAFAQYRCLEAYAMTKELPTIVQLVELVMAERIATLDKASERARSELHDWPNDARDRATKLVYDGLFELDAASQIVDITRGSVILDESNDVKRKIDAVFYIPKSWHGDWATVRIAFSRRTPDQLEPRERRRRWGSEAFWEFRCPITACDWVGDDAHVAFFPRSFVESDLAKLRDALILQPTLPEMST